MTETRDELAEALRTFGVPDDFVVLWPGDPVPDYRPLSAGPDYTWLAAPLTDGTWVLGGLDRGTFAPYDRYETTALAANAVRHLYFAPVEPVVLSDADTLEATEATEAIRSAVVGGRTPDAGEFTAGTAFDRFGPLSGHVLYTWRTPFPQRSSPPTDLGRDYVQLVLRRPWPTPVHTGVMRPWFGQPGGGVAVSLPRCVRWYFDAGVLDVFRTGPDEGAPGGTAAT